MRKGFGIATVLLLAAAQAGAGTTFPYLDYHTGSGQLPQSPSVTGGPVAAFANPAAWAVSGASGFDLWWNDRSVLEGNLDNWGIATGKNLGFAMQRSAFLDPNGDRFAVYDYQAGFAWGDRRSHGGIAWRWAGGESGRLGRENGLIAGLIHRPCAHASLGYSTLWNPSSNGTLQIADLGIRPFRKPWVTLFGEFSMRDSDNLDNGRWGAGFEVRPWRGIHLGMKLREDEGDGDYTYSLNMGLTFDGTGIHVLPGYDEDGDRGATHYLARFEPPYSGLPVSKFFRGHFGPRLYVPVDLENKTLTYRKARWFDDDRIAWIDLARYLDRIAEEPSVRGVAVNMAGLRVNPSIGWELREKLEELKKTGKEVLVHVDETGNFAYYIASAADRISLDPDGGLMLTGLAVYRTYMRGFFDKVGVGVEEWRYFTHKSAFEGFTRKEMSGADREQIGRLADVIYEEMRRGVCEAREITAGRFDELVDDYALFTADEALEAGLVDTLARWHDLGEWISENRDGARLAGLPKDREDGPHPDDVWGRPKEIAVVYALGECAMDTGIRGRATSKHMRGLADDPDVAAVVLRADSPGGSALASELVAEATRKLKENEKPVVVTQGAVAGSGGYWISMDGSRILTTPVTITGSIGVIGGWFWDDGIGGKTGFDADGVQRGAHSDLFTGIRFPLLGMLPKRNMTPDEKDRIHVLFEDLYGGFVKKVAAGRGLTEERVRELGEGRIWMGGDAIENKLVDRFGTLTDAVDEARELAGLRPDEEVILTEYPKRKLFELPRFGGGFPGLRLFAAPLARWLAPDASAPEILPEDYESAYFRILADSPGRPALLTPPEALPPEWAVME
ncbi:MAG: S49 family peptidase [Candidatus Eisenbacteria bacterium]|nr:S49 family peptidase [Candidatus Eisenbacteria bacterium]